MATLDLPDGLQRACRRRCTDRALHVATTRIFGNQGRHQSGGRFAGSQTALQFLSRSFVAIDIADVRFS